MKITSILLAGGMLPYAVFSPCWAAALTVAPISLSVLAPAQSAALTLRNRDMRPVDVQVRVFRWTQENGEDTLAPTDDVVASPPIVQIGPGGASAVRLQRLVGSRPSEEEAYRVVVDEIPDLNRQRSGAVNVLLRYSIPMFFGSAEETEGHLTWSIAGRGSASWLSADNDGDRHIQISNLALRNGRRSWTVAPGLSGYVLGHARRSWSAKGPELGLRPLQVTATSDQAVINAPVLP